MLKRIALLVSIIAIALAGGVFALAQATTTSHDIAAGDIENVHCLGPSLAITQNGVDATLNCAANPTTTTQPPQPTAPTAIANSRGEAHGGASSISIPKPTGTQSGDTVVAAITSADDPANLAAPNGWTLLDSTAINNTPAGGHRLHTFVHPVGAIDPGPYAFPTGSLGDYVGGAITLRGVSAVGVHGAVLDTTGPVLTTPVVTPAQGNSMVLSMFGQDQSGTAQSYTPGTGWTEVTDTFETTNQSTVVIDKQVQTTAAAISGNVTYSGNGEAARQGSAAIVALYGTVAPPPTTTTTPPPPAGADTIVTALSASPAAPTTSDAINFSMTVKNQGDTALAPGTLIGVGIYVDGAAASVTWGTSTSGLAAGASATYTTNGSGGGGAISLAQGSHSVVAIVDDENRYPESNETNNSSAPLTLNVGAGTPPPPPPSGQLFSASSLWNTPVPSGATFHDKAALRSGSWYLNWETYSIPVFTAASTDPIITVHVPATWGWPAGAIQLRAPASLNPAAGTDSNFALIDGNTSYDFWQFTWNNTAHTDASANAYAKADINGTGWGTPSPWKGAGIRAAGSSTLGGLIRGNEATAGINHALAVAGPGGQFCAEAPGGYIAPAISGDSACEGPRLAIPAGTAMPGGLSVQGQNVFHALQTYGGWAVDTVGCCAPANIYADPLSVPQADVSAIRNDLGIINQYVRMVN